MTRAEAEEIFTTCKAIANVLGKDLRELCRNRGVPEAMISELLRENEGQEVYDRFFKAHDDAGDLNLSERDIVLRLRNFGIDAGVDPKGARWIYVNKERTHLNSVELGLCRILTTRYGYRFR